jgi:2-methylcitrate dehydratase PrpD
MTASQRLADLIVRSSQDDLPPVAFERAKDCLLDFAACSIAGAGDPVGRSIIRHVTTALGAGRSTVIGGAARVRADDAALANGTLAHALDYDDVSWSMPGHPSAPVFPAALALAEREGRSGQDVIRAAAIGIETECKLGRATDPYLSQNGWHPSAVLGTMGATACAAVLLRLDTAETAQALGIACSLAGGVKANFGSMTKPLHMGVAARNGVTAAELARDNWSAGAGAIDGEFGFLSAFAWRCSLDGVLDSFGEPLDIIDPGICFKRHPSCAGTHPAIEALAGLIRQHDLGAQDVCSVTCRTTPFVRSIAGKDTPATGLEAKFSLPFCLAVYLLERSLQLSHFSDETVHSDAVREMMAEVKVIEDPTLSPDGFSGCASVVHVTLRDGRRLAGRSDVRPAAGGNLTAEELAAKFRDCVGALTTEQQRENILDHVRRFDELSSVDSFMRALGSLPLDGLGRQR